MSWKPEVKTDCTGRWYDNNLRFATFEEAQANAQNLMDRWFSVLETRVVESNDPVNYVWNPALNRVEPIKTEETVS